jgi:hypothetical protein
MVIGLEGRPLTRDEEDRIAAETIKRQLGSRSNNLGRLLLFWLRRWIKQTLQLGQVIPVVQGSRLLRPMPMAELTTLFVLGMFIGISAVLLAFFIL